MKSSSSNRAIKISVLVPFILVYISACGHPDAEPRKHDTSPTSNIAMDDGASEDVPYNLNLWPILKASSPYDPKLEERVDALLAELTLEQKVAQMIQPEIRDISAADMRKYGFGSYLNGGGAFPNNNKYANLSDWVNLAETFYQASVDDSLDGSSIPTMWGTDAVHGHNNVIGATLFPHNIGLGAMGNPDLVRKIAEATAEQVAATGIDWVFAPTVAVARDDRWGRTYESYSEDPKLVEDYSRAVVEGLQGHSEHNFFDHSRVIATAKHFIADGGTQHGEDRGNAIIDESELVNIHSAGYISSLKAGVQTVMASFNSWNGERLHGHKYLLTDVLKNRMGFDGIIVGDWLGHALIPGCTKERCSQAINAGLDIFMVPSSAWKPLYYNTIEQVRTDEIKESRIDDAVRRILRVKLRAGLFDKPSPKNRPYANRAEYIGHPRHKEIARQAVRESLVLLKNDGQLLPLNPSQSFLVAGDGADSLEKQTGGWSLSWQGTGNSKSDFPGSSSILDGLKAAIEAGGGSIEYQKDGDFVTKPDVAIVVFGENPYAEGNGDLDNLEFQRGTKSDLEILKRLKSKNIKVVSIFLSGRPMWVNPELNQSDSFIAAWLPGTEGGAVADVVIAQPNGAVNHPITGKLSFSWPSTPYQVPNRFDGTEPLFGYGYGLEFGETSQLEKLGESFDHSETSDGIVTLYEYAVNPPWYKRVVDESGVHDVRGSLYESPSISIKDVDKKVQEDATQISFVQDTNASFVISGDFPDDFRGLLEQEASINFALKVQIAPEEQLFLGLGCGENCNAKINISEQIQPQGLGEWTYYSMPLRCFAENGADLSRVFTPFSLSTSGSAQVTVAEIYVAESAKNDNTRFLSCSK